MASVQTDEAARLRAKAAETASIVPEAARETIDKYTEVARQAAEDVGARASQAGKEMSGAMQEVAGNFRQAIERSVDRRPVATVLMAVAAGVILGALMTRR